MRKAWAIIWRVIWVFIAVTLVRDFISTIQYSNDDFFGNLLEGCLTCILVNIPIYIVICAKEDAFDRFLSSLRWNIYPIRTILIEIVLAPLLTAYCIIYFSIQIIGILIGKYDI